MRRPGFLRPCRAAGAVTEVHSRDRTDHITSIPQSILNSLGAATQVFRKYFRMTVLSYIPDGKYHEGLLASKLFRLPR